MQGGMEREEELKKFVMDSKGQIDKALKEGRAVILVSRKSPSMFEVDKSKVEIIFKD